MAEPRELPGLRERTRRAVHAEISEAALALFAIQGFDATTVDQIAHAAGVSRRSFFRYFATKEDVVVGDVVERGRVMRDVLAARPPDEGPWEAIAEAFRALAREHGQPVELEMRIARLLHDEPSLRARHLEKHLAWQEALVPELTRRLRGTDGLDEEAARHRAAAIVASALACLDTAVDTWVRLDGARSLEDLWLDAVAAVRTPAP